MCDIIYKIFIFYFLIDSIIANGINWIERLWNFFSKIN